FRSRSNADLLVLLTPAATQLELLRGLDATGVDLEVAGFPYPEAQTRAFYAAARQASTRLGAQHRAAAWEASLDAYGAREINARYRAMYGEPMDAPAWSTYQAIKVLYEAAFFGGGTEADSVFAHLDAPTTVFDIWKGIGASFRPWDHQLRQSLYLVKVAAEPEAGVD